MEIKTKISEDNTVCTIYIKGDFNFSGLHEFNKLYQANITSEKIFVDFHDTNMIDSSALGMLLNLQKELNKADKEIAIINSNSVIRKILAITNFEKKFTVE